MRAIKWTAALLLLSSGLIGSSLADEGRHEHRYEHHDGWHGDIGRFHEHDFARWRGGRWHHGWHEGRMGWWWVVGGWWYFYPARVAAIPDPYVPPEYIEAAPPAGVQYWYYCANPVGYYPYVARCVVPWQAVAPTQPAAPLPAYPPPR